MTPLIWLLGACGPDVLLPDVNERTFVEGVAHPYLPMPVGATWTYEADTPDGLERDEVEVLDETRVVHGVTATVVRDTVYVDDVVVEDTWDWFAQDADGNVWYLGEDTCEFEGGACVRHAGAWEWGVDGALPGILMPADPTVDGQRYYQEHAEGEAEDVGEVVAIGRSAQTPAGAWDDCVRTHETSTLDPHLDEHKTYCRGVGLVVVEEPDFDVLLASYGGL